MKIKTMVLVAIMAVSTLFVTGCEDSGDIVNEHNELLKHKNVGSFNGYNIIKVRTTDDEYVYLAFKDSVTTVQYQKYVGKVYKPQPVIIIDGDTVTPDSARALLNASETEGDIK